MKFTTATIAAAVAFFAEAANANAVNILFMNQDGNNRTIHFVPAAGQPVIPEVNLPPNSNVTVPMHPHWNGMFRTMLKGEKWEEPSVVGEVTLGAFEGMHFFDVSAIGKTDDNTGIMHLYSSDTNKTVNREWSGCYQFPCGNAYLLPHDEGTRVTKSNNLTCEVGGHPSTLTRNKKDKARLPVIRQLIKEQDTRGTKPFWGTWKQQPAI